MSKVLHVIPRMVQGGAEKLLLDYLVGHQSSHRHQTLVLFEDNDERMVAALSGELFVRSSFTYFDVLRDVPRIRSLIGRERPDLVVTWLYHASFLSPLLVPGDMPILAYLHNTDLSVDAKWTERTCQRAQAWVARAHRVSLLYSGRNSQQFHENALGYPAARARVLPNGVSGETFAPDLARRRLTRKELGVPDDDVLFGCFGRFNPQKNWPLVLDAVSAAPSTWLVCAGRGVSFSNPDFFDLVQARGLQDRVLALDAQSDVARLYDAADVVLMASTYGEAFPLVLLEALAMGKPVIATALGSIPEIVDGLLEPVPVGATDEYVAAVAGAASGRWQGLSIKPEDLRDRALSRYGWATYCAGLDKAIDDAIGSSSS
jgi:glycosyltransferase involved in cell wall biosynthesis